MKRGLSGKMLFIKGRFQDGMLMSIRAAEGLQFMGFQAGNAALS
jgi:hypothetical protein